MKCPKLSILIPTVVTRGEQFRRLVDILSPQVQAKKGGIAVDVFWNNFEHPLGYIRQRMVEKAKGEYVVFIDDDDTVTEDYCDQIYQLLDGVDHIGMKLNFTSNGKQMKPVSHSIHHKGWYDDNEGFYRQLTAKDPIRKELALMGDYSKGDFVRGISEEKVWADAVLPFVETEHFIDKAIYNYAEVTDRSVFRRTKSEQGKFVRCKLPKYFKYMEIN